MFIIDIQLMERDVNFSVQDVLDIIKENPRTENTFLRMDRRERRGMSLRIAFSESSETRKKDVLTVKNSESTMAFVGFHLADDAGNENDATLVQYLEQSPIPIN